MDQQGESFMVQLHFIKRVQIIKEQLYYQQEPIQFIHQPNWYPMPILDLWHLLPLPIS